MVVPVAIGRPTGRDCLNHYNQCSERHVKDIHSVMQQKPNNVFSSRNRKQ